MRDIWYIKDNKRTKKINKKEIVDNQFRKNLRKGGTDHRNRLTVFKKFSDRPERNLTNFI